MIPALIDIGGPWKVLPAGIHDASLEEVKLQYAFNEHRGELFAGFVLGFDILWNAGARGIFLDGSFVTEHTRPRDFDCCWDPTGVDVAKLDPILLDFTDKRAAQKKKYRGEFFPSTFEATAGQFFFNYFQKDRYTGQAKGIIRVHQLN